MVSPALGTAATLGLTVGGGYLFGPVGAVAGALLGNFLFSGGGAKVEGPRLGDLTVGASTYGNVIPVCFATQKIAGTIIWAPPIQETKSTKKVGGSLFGGGSKVTEYRYHTSFAVAFAEGPAAGLVRLWAGEKLIADFQPPDFSEDLNDGASSMRYFGSNGRYKFRFYRGTADQLPDPLIRKQVEAELGESHITPGFRDIVYLVFERLALDEFGNRVPPITAEIAWDNDVELPERNFSSISLANGGIFPNSLITLGFGAIDWQRGYLYLYRNGNTEMGGVAGLRRYRLLDGQENLQALEADVTVEGSSAAVQPECVDADGYLYCRSSINTITKIDTETLREVARHTAELTDHTLMAPCQAYTLDGRTGFLFTARTLLNTDVVGVLRTSDMAYVYEEDLGSLGVTTIQGVVGGKEELGYCEAWATSFGGSGMRVIHVRIEAFAARVLDTTVGVSRTVTTITAAEIDPAGTSFNQITKPAYDIDDDAIIFSVRLNSANGPVRMVKYSRTAGIILTLAVPSPRMPHLCRFSRGIIGVHFDDGSDADDGRIFKVDTVNGTIVYNQIGWENGQERFFWHELSGTLVNTGTLSAMWPDRVSVNTVTLASVVSSLCGRVGLAADELDVTELTDAVRGFGVARQITVRGALELLAVAYLFDCAESDYKLRFKKRGRVSARTINEAELAPINPEGEIFLETRAQDIDLPLRFTVRYNDAERDADVATQTAKRIAAPTATMRSANEATLDLPLTLTPAQAKAVALQQCFGPWSERTGHQWKLPWTHLDLDPGDVVTVALSGRSYVVRILELAIGADLSIALQTVTEESAAYGVSAVTSGGLIFRRAIASPSAASRLVLADIPLLNDADDAQRLASGLYWFMGGMGQPAWPGGVLFESENGAAWLLREDTVQEMAWGLPIAALGDTDAPFQTDLDNELTVRMRAGANRLATVTELEMLNGANQALLIDPGGDVEILQFATVTANADGSHTLSTLLRGRRGTEQFTGGHSVASLFVLVEAETVNRLAVPLAALDAARYYRAVGRSEALRDALTSTIIPVGRDLMPYAPAQIAASGSWGADITLSWVRRTRIGGEMVDGGDDVPLAEDSEAYEVEILGTVDGPVLRTIEVTEPEAVYTIAQQAADWNVYHPLTLVNPGAETGDKSGWTNETGADTALVVDNDFQDLSAARTGEFFFRTPNSVSTDFRDSQAVDVSGWANPIDQGNAAARGRVYVNETDDGSDHGRVSLIFLDEDDNVLDSEEPSYLTLTPGTWTLTEAEATIPVGTRTIKICLDSRRDSLPHSVAFDDATLEIHPGNTLTELPVVVYQISAQVDRGFPGAATVEV
jgi:hypothetical protein